MTTKISAKPSKSNVVLTELVIVILFFALTAATAMQLFVGSHLKSFHNTMAQEAAVFCQDWAEQLRGESDMEGFLAAHGFERAEDGCYDLKQDHQTLHAELGLEHMASGTLGYAKLSVTDDRQSESDTQPLVALPVAAYAPNEEVAG